MRKKKIAHVLKSSIYSGAEAMALTIIRTLSDVYDFVYIATEGSVRKVLEQDRIPFVLLKNFDQKHLKRALAEVSPDLIHAHDFSATVLCVLCGHKRVVSHLHYDPPWARKWNAKTLAYTLLSRRISQIIAVSGGAYRNLIFSGLLAHKTIIISNPIDKDRILKMAGNVSQKRYDLLFAGRMVEQKAPQVFIEIVRSLKESGMDLYCAMLGEGELKEKCKHLIAEYGLQENIVLLGFQENPYPYMKEAKLLCMTSKWEGYGLVAAEANILGTPVVSTRTGGATELFGSDAEELCSDPEEFAEKIRVLLQEETQYHIWKIRAKKRADSFVSPDEYRKKIDLLYKKEMENI